MKAKRLMILAGSVCLALMLVVPLVAGCGPAAPEGSAEAELEAKLVAEKAKVADLEDEVADLEDEIAGLKAPGEVHKWQPAMYSAAGIIWDTLCWMADYMEKESNGRLQVNPSAPGAVCPVDEQLDAVATGITEAMMPWPGYFKGKVPIAAIQCYCLNATASEAEMRYLYDFYEDGRITELFREEYAKYGDVYLASNVYSMGLDIMNSNVPLYGIDDIEGVSFRASGMLAEALAQLGAGTCWFPVDEVYTSLATGVVDAVITSNVVECQELGLHEITKYWIKKPPMSGPGCSAFIVNGTVWKALPDDLKAIVEFACQAGSGRNLLEMETKAEKSWTFVENYGIEVVEWSAEDCARWAEVFRPFWDESSDDPACAEMYSIVEKYMIAEGYWK